MTIACQCRVFVPVIFRGRIFLVCNEFGATLQNFDAGARTSASKSGGT